MIYLYIINISTLKGEMRMSTPLYEKIYEYIIDQIKQGHLMEGDRVLSEKELAVEFDVSRITSKKALDLLAQNNIIERIRGKGSFVAHQQQENMESSSNVYQSSSLTTSKLVALIIPDFDNAFGLNLVKTIEKICMQNNCNLIIRRTGGNTKEEENAIIDLVKSGVDGLIIFPVHGEHYNTEILKLVVKDYPIVLVDRYLKGIPASSVCTNNQSACETLTNYLFTLGHKEIAFLSPSPSGNSTLEERLQGFHIAFSKQGLKMNPDFLLIDLISSLPQYVDHSESNMKADFHSIKQFILKNPEVTAFVVSEYYLSLTLMNVLKKLGKEIPEDYSIVCFDCPEDRFDQSLFTHIHQHEEEMGKKAVDLLLKQLKGEKIPKHTVIDFTLIEGKSSAPNQRI
jgi:GntR family transcriptional regulator, arabinose operon transcriptional repressor